MFLCLVNTRSVRNRTTDILDHIHEHNLDSVALSETWLSTKDADLSVIRDFTPPGYKLIHHPRSSRRGGSIGTLHKDSIIGILHKDSIKATVVNTFNDIRSFEPINLTLTSRGKSIILLVVY